VPKSVNSDACPQPTTGRSVDAVNPAELGHGEELAATAAPTATTTTATSALDLAKSGIKNEL